MKHYLVVITCDVNDGDYIKSHFRDTEEGLARVRKAINTVQRLKKSYYDFRNGKNFTVYLSYKDGLPYYGDMMEPILEKYEWCFADKEVSSLEWVDGLSKEDVDDALYLYNLLPYFDNENVHTINSIEAYEITGEIINLV